MQQENRRQHRLANMDWLALFMRASWHATLGDLKPPRRFFSSARTFYLFKRTKLALEITNLDWFVRFLRNCPIVLVATRQRVSESLLANYTTQSSLRFSGFEGANRTVPWALSRRALRHSHAAPWFCYPKRTGRDPPEGLRPNTAYWVLLADARERTCSEPDYDDRSWPKAGRLL